jgi:hypothetical protein
MSSTTKPRLRGTVGAPGIRRALDDTSSNGAGGPVGATFSVRAKDNLWDIAVVKAVVT